MAGQFTKYTGTVVGNPGGLLPALDAALVTGQLWTKPYTATNQAVYRPPSGNRFYYLINDTNVNASAAEAFITGYEIMSSTSTATAINPFPTLATSGAGIVGSVIRKSATVDTTARTYQIYCDARTAYLFVLTGDNAGMYLAGGWGEIFSLVNADLYNSVVSCRKQGLTGSGSVDTLDYTGELMNAGSAGLHFSLARAYNGLPTINGAITGFRHGDGPKSNNVAYLATQSNTYLPAPNPADGGIYASPVWVTEQTTSGLYIVRGRMRGFWQLLHSATYFNDGDTFSGTGDLAGKTFAIIKGSGNGGAYCIETSATLETN